MRSRTLLRSSPSGFACALFLREVYDAHEGGEEGQNGPVAQDLQQEDRREGLSVL
jgi:hypothetical protein